MFKKKNRLTKEQFDRFFRSGKRLHTSFFTLVYTKHSSFHSAVVVGKKVSNKSVVRNKIRRRMYNALYAIIKEQKTTGVFIVLVKPQAKDVSSSELKDALVDVVGRVDKRV